MTIGGSMRARNAGLAGPLRIGAAGLLLAALGAPSAQAFQLDLDNPDVRVLWDTTVKYSAAWRVEGADARLLAEPGPDWPNTDDGDRNFRKPGLISNRLDLLSELDFVYKRHYGFRVSGAAWYDTEYMGRNQNDAPGTSNIWSGSYDRYTAETRRAHGRNVELLDAFVFGRADLGDRPLTMRLGRHSLVWGETLFFGANGIANAQAPIDVIKAQSVPGTQFKELMRPVNQVSAQLQLTPSVALGAYYQFEWEKSRLPAAGSYFSGVDFFGDGGERMLVGHAGGPFANAPAFFRGDDVEARNSGQGGLQLKFRIGEVDYGLYAVRYHDKTPQLYLRPAAGMPNFATGRVGSYVMVYPEDVSAYGISATASVGNVNLAGELSLRHNAPLSSDARLDVTGLADNQDRALYAVGNTLHLNLSAMVSLGPNFLAREADLMAEIAWNRVTRITSNEDAVNPNATRDASNLRVTYTPKYRQVFPGVDLSVPISVGYGLQGNSMAVGSFYGKRVGDVSVGVSGSYLDAWRFGLNYTHYFGPVGTFLEYGSDGNPHGSYKQHLADRDFVSFTLQRTF